MCRSLFIKLLFLLLSPVFLTVAKAQQDPLHFINYTTKDGLSSSLVNVIIKDNNGYIWFGTEEGLNKFDGVNFTVYRHNSVDSSSIGSNAIRAIHKDKFGNLWVGTSRTLSLYDPKKDAFVNYDFTKYSSIRALFSDNLGNIWVGGYGGVFKFNPGTNERKNYNADKGELKSNTILSIFEDSKHRLWIGTNKGLHLYQKNRDRFEFFEHSENQSSSISDNIIRSINEDANGTIWVGTNDGLNKLQPDGKSFKAYYYSSNNANTISNNCIYTISADRTGRLWIGTEDGLSLFDTKSEQVLRVKNDPRDKYSLKGKSVKSIFIDKDGIYWVGTSRGGVNKYDENLAFFNHRQSNPFDKYGLNYPVVSSFVEGAGGKIYIGTDGGGLNIYNRITGLFDHIQLDPKKPALAILAMERVGNELWIGTYQGGLYVFNMVSGAVVHYDKGDGPKDLAGNEIFCLKKDSKGNVWIGTNGNGVNMFDARSGTFRKFDKDYKGSGGKVSVNGFIRAIEEDKSGNIWIGSNGAGIIIYNFSSASFEALHVGNSQLPSNEISSILRDEQDNMWVGTPGGGLSHFDFASRKFTTYAEPDGLSNAVIYKILDDDGRKVWVSTNKGLSCFDPITKKFKNYTYYHGLQQTSFILGSGLKTTKGELFFGGLDGFNYFDPRSLKVNSNTPSVQFTSLKVSNKTVVPGDDEVITEHISIAKKISLDYKQNFSIDFVALNYTEPRSSRYSYKLDGFDKAWNHVGTAQTAVYTNLDPGEYTFRLKATSDDGLWTTPEKTIKIQVMPPVWRTIYAYAFYFLVAGLFLIGLRYQAVRKVRKKFVIEQVKKEAQRQHEFDQGKIKFLTNLSHEFRTPISLIAGPVDKLLQREHNEQKIEQLNMVKRNAGRLLNLVNQLLDFRKLEENELKLNLTDGDLVSFVKEVTEMFKDMSERKHINFTFGSSLGHFNTQFDKDKIERILFNLLSNAFKFTPKHGEVSLSIEKDFNSGIKIIISDTGVGMTPEEKDKIFERFFQGNVQTSVLNQGSGIGLSITKEFIKLHGGSIDVESMPGKGSVFTVLLPCEPISKPITKEFSETVLESSSIPELPGKNIPALEKLTVLIVEDNEDFRCYLRDNLKPFYKIIEASNGKEGWQKALSTHPHVIVSDISMPEMDGISFSRKLKSDKRTSHIPIILLTAINGNSNQLLGLQTGANDYLTKPFDSEILNIKIRNLVNLNENFKNTYSKQIKVTAPDVEPQSEDEKLLLKIAEFIEANIDSPDLSVEELSKHVFMNRRTLYNKIVSLTGETPVEFIRSIKLNKAAALLENTDMRISEVGYAVGFGTANYFARAFKAKFNISPSDYLALKKGGVQSDKNSD